MIKNALFKHIYSFIIISGLLVVDIITKNLIVKNFFEGEKLDYLGGFLRITLVYNRGGVFGIAQGHKTIFLIISCIVLLFLIGYYIYLFFVEKLKSGFMMVTLSLIISGALGNIIDRLIPERKGVVDFISVKITSSFRWPAFNFADSVIVLGAFMLVFYIYKEEKKQKLLHKLDKN